MPEEDSEAKSMTTTINTREEEQQKVENLISLKTLRAGEGCQGARGGLRGQEHDHHHQRQEGGAAEVQA